MANINSEYYFIAGGVTLSYRVKEQPEYEDLDWELNMLGKPMKKFESPLKAIKVCYNSPKSNQDYYRLDGGHHLFSQRICDIMKKFNPVNIGYIPAIIELRKKIYPDYYILHIYNEIDCWDKINSKWEREPNYDPEHEPPKREVRQMHKLLLDEKKLNAIPLEQRLIFKLKNVVFDRLFHESIINEFEKIKPKGFHVINLNEWEDGLLDGIDLG